MDGLAMMPVDRQDFHDTFKTLKPVCDAFITDANDENTAHLKYALNKVSKAGVQHFHPYVLIPLEIQLKMSTSTNHILNVMDVLKTLLNKIPIKVMSTFLQIYKMLLDKISDKKDPHKVMNLPEEVKLSIIVTMNLFIKRSDIALLNKMYTDDFLHVGYLLYICTKVVKDEKMNILRVEAIKCIEILSSIWDKNADFDTRIQILKIVIKFVPGILSTCIFLVDATDIQHHSITVAALSLWSTVFSLIVCDEHIIEESNPYLGESLSKNENGAKNELNNWIQDNSDKFNVVISHMIKSREHKHWRVRLQLVSSCDIILNKCTSSIKSSIINLIETIITLSDDEQIEVEKIANESVDNLHKIFDRRYKKSLVELLKESFYTLLSRIPRCIRTSSYIQQKVELSLLSGYLKLFGKAHFLQIIHSSAHLDRLITALIQILELEYKTITLLEESSIRDLNTIPQYSVEMSLNVPWKQLIHFNDNSALIQIENICKLIGLYGCSDVIGRYLMDLFDSKIMYRSEITLLMNIILSENSGKSHYSVVKDVIDLYLEHNIWYLPTNVGKNSNISIADAQRNVVQICLMTEGLARLVSSLCVTKQGLCLINCLYPILERIGSEIGHISLAGQGAIALLVQSGNYNDPIDIVTKNSDYLSHHFTTKLWLLNEYPEVLNALKVMMNINNSDDLLQTFHTLVTNVLVQSCDIHRTDDLHSFMKVFHIFVICVRKLQQKMSLSTNENIQIAEPTSNCVLKNILEYHRFKTSDYKDESWNIENDDIAPMENIKDINEDKKKSLPPYIQMTISIIERMLNFLPLKHHFLPLQILNEGLHILSNYEDQLLPIVYKVWSPLCTKFNNDTEDRIFCEAFNVLCTMALTAKSFVRCRSLCNVLPSILQRLESSAKASKNISKGSVYFTSHKYKLQNTVLSGLGDFVLNVTFIEDDMFNISRTVAHYLDINQPMELQNKCREFYKKLYAEHSDFVWIFLQSLAIDEYEFKSENKRLPSIKVCGSSTFKRSNILKNVTQLQKQLIHV